MIAVKVRYAGLPRSETGKREEIWSMKEGATLEELLAAVASKYRWRLDDGSRFIIVYNDYGIHRDHWPDQTLRDSGDLVMILSSITGG